MLWRVSEQSATRKTISLAVNPSTQDPERSAVGMLEGIHNVMASSLFDDAFPFNGPDVDVNGFGRLGTSSHSSS
jgi:hypothetical protein